MVVVRSWPRLFKICSVFVCMALALFQKHVVQQLIHIYISRTCEGFNVTDECLPHS